MRNNRLVVGKLFAVLLAVYAVMVFLLNLQLSKSVGTSRNRTKLEFWAIDILHELDGVTSAPSESGMDVPMSNTTSKPVFAETELLRRSAKEKDPILKDWLSKKGNFCGDHFSGYSGLFAELHDVTIDSSKGNGRKGGEDPSVVLSQSEALEYFTLLKGYFRLPCGKEFSYNFKGKNHLSSFVKAIEAVQKINYSDDTLVVDQWTLVTTRIEYANVYWQMMECYDAFLMMQAFNINPNSVGIILLDGHPSGALDDVWPTLFTNVIRAGNISRPMLFRNMVWTLSEGQSPLMHSKTRIPYLEEFRQFFLTKFKIPLQKTLDCSNVTVLFIWRRDYLAHPRNPSGKVQRKIANENELLEAVNQSLPGHNVKGYQLDKLPFRTQVSLIAETDIFVGMHGAGLSFTLFLPSHGGLIELHPSRRSTGNTHFKDIAQWRSLRYASWYSVIPDKIHGDFITHVPASTTAKLVTEMYTKMCSQKP